DNVVHAGAREPDLLHEERIDAGLELRDEETGVREPGPWEAGTRGIDQRDAPAGRPGSHVDGRGPEALSVRREDVERHARPRVLERGRNPEEEIAAHREVRRPSV